MRGEFANYLFSAAAGEYIYSGHSYVFTLTAGATAHYIPFGTTPPTGCPGTGSNPQAAPGHLCLYEILATNVSSRNVYNSTPSGFIVGSNALNAGVHYSFVAWAVTAP